MNVPTLQGAQAKPIHLQTLYGCEVKTSENDAHDDVREAINLERRSRRRKESPAVPTLFEAHTVPRPFVRTYVLEHLSSR